MKLYKYQQEIVDRIKEGSFALFAEVGTGKTAMAINAIKNFDRVIVFSPKITLRNWQNEFKMWRPDLKTCVVIGTLNKKLKLIRDNNILIINYESVRSFEVYEELLNFEASTIICDESHKIKSIKAVQTERVIDIGRNASQKFILTGTPITNSYEDVFSQFLFMDNGDSFGRNYFAFRNKYFFNKNAGWNSEKAFPDWQLIPSMKDELISQVNLKSIFLKKEDCVDLPELVEMKIEIEMSKNQRKHYEEIRKELITWLDTQPENPMVVQNALTKLIRLNEICSGYLKLENGDICEIKDNPKLEALIETIESIVPSKVIVFCCFRENYKDIRIELLKKKIKFVEIHGGISDKDKFDNIDVFNDMTSGVNVIIVNPASGGTGINLKSASYSIYYSRTFNLEHYIQSKGRNYRSGSIDLHKKITHINLITINSIDEEIYKSLLEKKSLLNDLESIKKILLPRGDTWE